MSVITVDIDAIKYCNEVFYSLPLHKRLTDKERHKFRVKMKMALLHPFPTTDRESLTVTTLIEIFGKSMFRDILKLYEAGKLTKETKV